MNIVCYKVTPAGVLLWTDRSLGTLQVLLDYSPPIYRDGFIGTFLYSKLYFKGIRTLVFEGKAFRVRVALSDSNGLRPERQRLHQEPE